MIHLTTGGNGSGKTLNTLKWVRELQVQQGRSVYYANLNIKPEKAAEFGWQPFEVEKWQELPDGSILIVDECQDFFGPRPNGSKVPDHIAAMAKHRHRGFDFFLITQHPRQLDGFLKSQIASPGWHKHCIRPFGRDMTSVLAWSSVHDQPHKPGAGKTANVTLTAHPREVYTWYNSSTLHTNRKTIPRQVWVVLGAVLLVPVLGWFAWSELSARAHTPEVEAATQAAAQTGPDAKATADPFQQMFEDYNPRIPGFPHTAPRYDKVTEPVVAPYPAACIAMGDKCTCFTQQGTRLATDGPTCHQIVKDGYFIDWEQRSIEAKEPDRPVAQASPAAPIPAAPVPSAGVAQPVKPWTVQESRVSYPGAASDGAVLAFMRERSGR